MTSQFKQGIVMGLTASILFEFIVKPLIQKHINGETA